MRTAHRTIPAKAQASTSFLKKRSKKLLLNELRC
jgi:hypothetical protein